MTEAQDPSVGGNLPETASMLFLCLPGIGDAVFALPAIRSLKKDQPRCRITCLTMFPGARDLLEMAPAADEVIQFDFRRQGILRSLFFMRGLRNRRYDVCVTPYPANRLEYNVISWLSGAPVRLAHRYQHMARRGGAWLNTHTIMEDLAATNIEENLRLIRQVTGATPPSHDVSIRPPRESALAAEAWLSNRSLGQAQLIALHPGGSTPKNHIHKRWPPERFAELGRRLCQESESRLLVFGGPEEEPVKEQVVTAAGPTAFPVDLPSIKQVAALLSRCALFVGNDNALLHVAGAVGTPAVGVFGPTSAQWVRLPDRPRKEVTRGLACQPCFVYSPRHLRCQYGDYRCLTELPVDDVLAAALSVIDGQAASRRA